MHAFAIYLFMKMEEYTIMLTVWVSFCKNTHIYIYRYFVYFPFDV